MKSAKITCIALLAAAVAVTGRDFFHLSPTGECFQALLWTSFIFNVDVTPCAYRQECVTPAMAELMRWIVKDFVKPGRNKQEEQT